jgi:hypothetical protein
VAALDESASTSLSSPAGATLPYARRLEGAQGRRAGRRSSGAADELGRRPFARVSAAAAIEDRDEQREGRHHGGRVAAQQPRPRRGRRRRRADDVGGAVMPPSRRRRARGLTQPSKAGERPSSGSGAPGWPTPSAPARRAAGRRAGVGHPTPRSTGKKNASGAALALGRDQRQPASAIAPPISWARRGLAERKRNESDGE